MAFDDQWIVEVRDLLANNNVHRESENSDGARVCRVPEYWCSAKPNAFIPQFVGLGLYHHFRPELPFTDEIKLVATQNILKVKGSLQQLLQKLALDHPEIQGFFNEADVSSTSNYNNHLRALTVDGLFLLGLLQLKNKLLSQEYMYSLFVRHRMPLFNSTGVELTMDVIKRDVFLLENQLPIRFLKQIMDEIQPPEEVGGDHEELGSALIIFCEACCPFVEFERLSKSPQNHEHLIELLYHLMVSDSKSVLDRITGRVNYLSLYTELSVLERQERNPLHKQVLELLIFTVVDMFERPVLLHRPSASINERSCCSNIIISLVFRFEIIISLVFRFVFRLVLIVLLFVVYIVVLIGSPFLWVLGYLFDTIRWELYDLLPFPIEYLSHIMNFVLKVFHNFEAPLSRVKAYETMVRRIEMLNEGLEPTNPTTVGVKKLTERYLLEGKDMDMAATELQSAGINFNPADGGISSIEFSEASSTFYLPRIKLDVNSEVIIRNLLAYEQLTKSKDLILSSYIYLMRDLVDTPEDAELLVREKIIETELSGKAVHQLFEGMDRSIRAVVNPELAYQVLNLLYKFNENRNLKRALTKYSNFSANFFMVLAVLIFLVLMAVQTYCSVFGCSHVSESGQLPVDGGNCGTINLFSSSI